MSISMNFVNIKSIAVGLPATVQHENPAIGMYTTQRLVIALEDGSRHHLVFFLETGMNALALGELITNTQVSA
jgi:hypothetical protein